MAVARSPQRTVLSTAVPKVSLPLVDAVIDRVERLHRAVDTMVAPLTAQHAERLQCRVGCTGCCVDDLSVFEAEAAVILRHHAALLASESAHPIGRCAFLDSAGGCRIYAQRPYVCRTQGLPLRWLEESETEAGHARELRDICELNETAEPIEALTAEHCWTLGPVEERLQHLQAESKSGRRIKLRDLFGR